MDLSVKDFFNHVSEIYNTAEKLDVPLVEIFEIEYYPNFSACFSKNILTSSKYPVHENKL